MKLQKLNINNIRNHFQTEIELSEGLNIFHGLNGSGKTSILESISIAAFSKSFLPAADSSLIRFGEEFYRISVEAQNDYGIPYKVSIKFSSKTKKEINSTLGDNLLPKDIIGEIPTVVLSPDYKSITFGAPQDRRDFIDRILSQSNKIYLEELMKYKKILRQRNNLLNQSKSDRYFDKSIIEPWTEMLLKTGSELVFRRIKFIEEFVPFFNEVYTFVSGGKEEVSIKYAPNHLSDSLNKALTTKEEIYNHYHNHSKKIFDEECRRGVTLYGPQKDELKIIINTGIAKETASQGQHKSLLISIKFAEFNYLRDRKNETPIALLDDIFSELDKDRSKKVLELISMNYAQTFITLTEAESIKQLLPTEHPFKYFSVNNGIVV